MVEKVSFPPNLPIFWHPFWVLMNFRGQSFSLAANSACCFCWFFDVWRQKIISEHDARMKTMKLGTPPSKLPKVSSSHMHILLYIYIYIKTNTYKHVCFFRCTRAPCFVRDFPSVATGTHGARHACLWWHQAPRWNKFKQLVPKKSLQRKFLAHFRFPPGAICICSSYVDVESKNVRNAKTNRETHAGLKILFFGLVERSNVYEWHSWRWKEVNYAQGLSV